MSRSALLLGMLLTVAASAQRIEVYSEFRRIDPFGEIVAADSEGRPREILSPLFARNSHSTLFVIAKAPPGKIYYLYVTASPEEALDVTVYKALYSREDDVWVPDGLLPAEIPYTGHVPDRYHNIPSQTAEMFVVDVWVNSSAKPGRMKLDVQLNVDDLWLIYPMEVRISTEVAPDVAVSDHSLPPVTARSDASVLGPLREYLCGVPEQGRSGGLSIRSLSRRNAVEDIALAASKEGEVGADGVANTLLRGLEIDRPTFCSADELESPYGPEWFLRSRDFLYRGTIRYY